MSESNKKARSANYTLKERELLVNLAVKYKNVIENKKTDAISVSEKNSVWKKISNEFNTVAPNLCYRSADSLKKLYENRKKELRKKVGEYKKEIYLTGGGPPPKLPTEATDDLLLEVVSGKTVFGLENPFDNDKTPPISKIQGRVLPKQSKINLPSTSQQLSVMQCSDENYINISEEIQDNTTSENNIEIIFDDETEVALAETDWSSYKPSDLAKPLTESLKRPLINGFEVINKRKKILPEVSSRRRPHSTIKTLSASSLYDKYEALVDKKLVNEDYLRQKYQLEVECKRREHELKVKVLELDIELKNKELHSSRKCFTFF